MWINQKFKFLTRKNKKYFNRLKKNLGMIYETFVDGLTDPEMIQNAKLEWQYGMARHVTDTPFYLINQITISEEKLQSFD